jgi:hypothetical protein
MYYTIDRSWLGDKDQSHVYWEANQGVEGLAEMTLMLTMISGKKKKNSSKYPLK